MLLSEIILLQSLYDQVALLPFGLEISGEEALEGFGISGEGALGDFGMSGVFFAPFSGGVRGTRSWNKFEYISFSFLIFLSMSQSPSKQGRTYFSGSTNRWA